MQFPKVSAVVPKLENQCKSTSIPDHGWPWLASTTRDFGTKAENPNLGGKVAPTRHPQRAPNLQLDNAPTVFVLSHSRRACMNQIRSRTLELRDCASPAGFLLKWIRVRNIKRCVRSFGVPFVGVCSIAIFNFPITNSASASISFHSRTKCGRQPFSSPWCSAFYQVWLLLQPTTLGLTVSPYSLPWTGPLLFAFRINSVWFWDIRQK